MFFLKNKKRISSQKKIAGGFTLVEMIVSVAIFTIVAFVAVGALLKVIDANKKSQSLKTSINNLNFALESLSREMRVGSNYTCISGSSVTVPISASSACPSGYSSWTIAFNSSKPYPPAPATPLCQLVYAYHYDGITLYKAEQSACGSSMGAFAPIISADVKFTTGTIKVVTGFDIQSYAQFHFTGYSGVKEKNKTYFDLQTTVSQRLAD